MDIVNKSNCNQINCGLIKDDNFIIINLCKNGWTIMIFSTNDEGKSVIAERFTKTFNSKIFFKK